MSKKQQGFTLVEMSIVLVIIGLIVGGVLVGQDLVKAAQIRAVVSQLQQYDAAINTFRGKYDCMPGDCNKASKFLGCTAGVLGATTQCDGDGDGRLDDLASTAGSAGAGTANTLANAFNGELLAFWYHLSLANMVAGQYTLTTAAAAPGATTTTADVYHPATKLKKGTVVAVSEGSTGSWIVGASTTMGAYAGGTAGVLTGTGANNLTPTEAFGVDNKLDDGMANTGMAYHVVSHSASALTGIATTATSATTCWATTPATATTPVDYLLSNQNNSCTLRIRMQGS